jgi:glycosyltransferase involved in cell wall biosynthesis
MRVWIAVNQDLVSDLGLTNGIKVLPLPINLGCGWPSTLDLLRAMDMFLLSARYLKYAGYKFGWDILHFHLPNAYLLSLLYRGLPKVFTIHGRIFENAVLRLFEPYLCLLAVRRAPTSAISRYAVKAGWLRRRVQVIPNGVDPAVVSRLAHQADPDATWLREVRLKKSGPILVFPGILIRRKGQDLMIDSMPLLLERYPHAVAVFLGEGPDEMFLKERARSLGVERSMFFLGYKRNPYPYLLIADVVLSHLSRRWPFPSLVDLEALALGKPVITYYTDEKYELYQNTVHYIREESPSSLVKAIEDALMSDMPEARLARKERALRLSWPRIVERYSRLYSLTLKG